jgi:hypothetical protein
MSKPKVVEIRLERLVPESDLDQDDKDLPLSVLLEVDADVPVSHIANAALDAFHSEQEVACLDDFDFRVFYNSVEMVQDDTVDSYALKENARLI